MAQHALEAAYDEDRLLMVKNRGMGDPCEKLTAERKAFMRAMEAWGVLRIGQAIDCLDARVFEHNRETKQNEARDNDE